MRQLYQYLTALNPDLTIACFIAALFTLEQIAHNFAAFRKSGSHLLTNVLLQTGYILLNLGVALVLVSVFEWMATKQIGLFYQVKLPYGLKVIAGVLCIDLVNYWAHRLYHTLGLFWRLHRVHHSDTFIDSSSAYRFHPFDAILDNAASVAAAFVFGLDPSILLCWFILYIPVLVLHHTKFTMPQWFDKTFGQVIVSPNFHKVHHHQDQEFTDSNYGLLFIFWDKLFKTFKQIPVSEIVFGLEEFNPPERQSVGFLLKSPFMKLKK